MAILRDSSQNNVWNRELGCGWRIMTSTVPTSSRSSAVAVFSRSQLAPSGLSVPQVCSFPSPFTHWVLMVCFPVEHHTLYQYNLQGASNHWIGFVQTETVSIQFLSLTISNGLMCCSFSHIINPLLHSLRRSALTALTKTRRIPAPMLMHGL